MWGFAFARYRRAIAIGVNAMNLYCLIQNLFRGSIPNFSDFLGEKYEELQQEPGPVVWRSRHYLRGSRRELPGLRPSA